ncbi:putative bifunctional diguanylate cyclase/phosphodiesterase [Spongisporangium articulatum]|uniref:Bifunctional diguanylate cyclase/phosphodiesterase n=1 Tax=Spongisporangium articulatum TaxID=3362603 RepID=A0ABW8AJI8_9ACTN
MIAVTPWQRTAVVKVSALSAALTAVSALAAHLGIAGDPDRLAALGHGGGVEALATVLIPMVLFAIADACPVTLRRGRTRIVLTLTVVPVMIGLLAGAPLALLVARVVSVAVPALLWRREPLIKAWLQTAAALFGVTLAAVALNALSADGQVTTPALGTMSTIAACAALAVVVEALLLHGTQGWYESTSRLNSGQVLLQVLPAVVVGALLVIGAVDALGRDRGAIAAAALLTVVLLIYRASSRVASRHASLERLYVLSDSLAVTKGSMDVVRSVLQESAKLLRAEYAEVMLTGMESGVQLWSVRPGQPVYGPVEPGAHHRTLPFPPPEPRVVRGTGRAEREYLIARKLREAAVVPIRIDGPVTGHLLVGDRVGDDGRFTGPDLRLLETVANHAGVALRNGRLIEQLNFEARHDELTGLPNRLRFRTLIDEAAAGLAAGVPCAVMVLDFNGFKAINDTLGHQAGDELLKVLAGRFAKAVAGRATVARLGGDEFAVLATGVDGRAAALEIADLVMGGFEEPIELGGTRLRVGGSLGIALGPQHARTGAELLRMADVAMYVAKSGAGGARVYSPEFAPGSSEVLTLATDLREALMNDQIEILVQPIVDLHTLNVHSLEALARWRHPVLGDIAPKEFFAAADRAGLTLQLSQRVLDHALAACRYWAEQGTELRISVNMESRWLNNSALPDQIARALRGHGVPAELLCLEIKEGSVMDDPARALEVLTALRTMGVHLSVDDFGTGYSSLTYLSRLPVDQVKIDRSFVEMVSSSGRDQAIVASILGLGANLGMEVVAEGVSDAATRRILLEMGCRIGQGFLFSRPITVEEVPVLLERIRKVGWPVAQRPPAPAAAPTGGPARPVVRPTGGPARPVVRPTVGAPAMPTVTPHVDRVQAWPTQQPPGRY